MDSVFLYAESESMPLHVLGVLTLSASDGGPVEDYRRVRALLESRLDAIPMLRRKLVEVPLRLDRPVWVEDPGFSIDHHLERAELPAPGGEGELADFVARVAERPLPRDRPLWEMRIVEGLSDRRFAIVSKIHHAAADGTGCANLMCVLLDADPQARRRPAARPMSTVGRPSPLGLLGQASVALATNPIRGIRQTARSSRLGVRLLRSALGRQSEHLRVPRTRLNRRISPRRAVAMGRVSLGDVKVVKRAQGATVNHVILASCAGALRSYLRQYGECPQQPLVAAVPVALGSRAEDGMGNALSSILVELPVHLASALERVRAVREASHRARSLQAVIGNQLGEWADLIPPLLLAGTSRLYSRLRAAQWHPPLQNVIISNVPGPHEPLYCAGAHVRACHPFGPIYDGCALNLTVMSYDGDVGFGAIACPDAVPDLETIPRAFESSMAELVRSCRKPGVEEALADALPLHRMVAIPGMPSVGCRASSS